MILIIKMSAELVGEYEPEKDLIKIERMARNEFISKIAKAGHESVIEHVSDPALDKS